MLMSHTLLRFFVLCSVLVCACAYVARENQTFVDRNCLITLERVFCEIITKHK